MSSSLPKFHELICDTFTPTFEAGAEDCTLVSYVSRRGYLLAGNTLFRSIALGTEGIGINITVTWLTNTEFDSNGLPIGGHTITSDILSMGIAKIRIVPSTDSPHPTETYYTKQFAVEGSPAVIYYYSAIPRLRDLINSQSNLVTMPLEHNGVAFDNEGSSAIVLDGDILGLFTGETSHLGVPKPSSYLHGDAYGSPQGSPLIYPSTRTGPTFAMIHVTQFETKAGGDLVLGSRDDIIMPTTNPHGTTDIDMGDISLTDSTVEQPDPKYSNPTHGYHEIKLIGTVTLSTATGYRADTNNTNGYQKADFNRLLVGSISTGVANDATVYTASVLIDGTTTENISVIGTDIQTFDTLITQINIDLTLATATLNYGDIKIFSNTTIGEVSTISITEGTLFPILDNYQGLLPAVQGTELQVLNVNYKVDGGADNIFTFFGWQAQTYGDLITRLTNVNGEIITVGLHLNELLDDDFTPANLGERISIQSKASGTGSTVEITETNAFTELDAYTELVNLTEGHTYHCLIQIDVMDAAPGSGMPITIPVEQFEVEIAKPRDEISTYNDVLNCINDVINTMGTLTFVNGVFHFESLTYGSTSRITVFGDDMLSEIDNGILVSSPYTYTIGEDATTDIGNILDEDEIQVWNSENWVPFALYKAPPSPEPPSEYLFDPENNDGSLGSPAVFPCD